MEINYLKIIVSISIAVIGWLIAHYFAEKRTIRSKRRELVTEHLINSYRVLAAEVSQRKLTSEMIIKYENILSDIQLFGSVNQVDLAKNLAKESASSQVFELDPLINSLRDSLRKELNLKSIDGNVRWLRISENKK